MADEGKLYIVAIPIGNQADISQRALETLKSVDVIISEESSAVKSLSAIHGFKKQYFVFNEHNEEKDADYVINFLLKGESCALISDCGTPTFADPGKILLQRCYSHKITVVPVPGPSALMTLLSLSPIDIRKFLFAGFLQKTKQDRIAELKKLKLLHVPVVLMDTPYRLLDVMADISEIFNDKKVLFLYKATMPEEIIRYDMSDKIYKYCKENELKGEFMVLVEN
ncbi:MAG TPA: 16S rRNA (cytidine(1402)-2'-O)-methyltransferase [Clostridiales bacterium]|nr:16S rRNA (cytidine(1402)-2'-O)-methyltransferase [Clostridiales bacterium]HQP70768.1 16S rRNA (cytidine(1402)-2'-O)-methyltransferase [Clostridiales bacterium]